MKRFEDDEEIQRLLAAARPMPKRTDAERERSAAFVAALARTKPSRQRGYERWAWRALAAAAIVVLSFVGGDSPDEGTPEVAIVKEPASEPMSNGFTWYVEKHKSLPGEDTVGQPGVGDVCGARVCDFMPSCCEGKWDAACDRKLLELTRGEHSITLSVGRCYWHDREICPKCACPYYLKRIEDRQGQIATGYDGWTGCLRDQERMLLELKWMCVQRYCEE